MQQTLLAVPDYAALEADEATHPLKQSYSGLGYVVYKRTYARNVEGENRTEEWHETVARMIRGAREIDAGLTEDEEARLFDHIWNLRGFPGGRMLWQLGTDNVQRLGGDSLVNCWYTNLEAAQDFGWLMDRLMLGGGVGFSVNNGRWMGTVIGGGAVRKDGFDVDHVVPDNREGWSELLVKTITAWFEGEDFTYSVDAIRPAGTPIKTFGGKASGSKALVDGVNDIQDILYAARGRELSSVDILDMANIVGGIVVSGNVRRSAQIAQGNATDVSFMQAKRWDLGGIPNWRAMSNNSVVTTDVTELPQSFWDGYEGNGEAYGMLNVKNARKYGRMGEERDDPSVDGFNPCAEIGLADRESCNLSELVLPHFESQGQMLDCATLLYKVQKAIAALPYLDARSASIAHTNMRLGLGVTGVLEATERQTAWLGPIYEALREVDKDWSAKNGWPESVRLTTVKPSGTLSLLAGVLPGGHPGFAKHHVRRVRMAANDPVLEWCKARGYGWEWQRGFDGVEDTRTAVVSFPVELPDTAKLSKDITAVDQLDIVAWLQRHWADNAVSVSVYYSKDELPAIQEYLYDNWRYFKSLSFLLHSEHGFDQAPMEEITQAEYEAMAAQIDHVHTFTVTGNAVDIEDSDCEGGACPIR